MKKPVGMHLIAEDLEPQRDELGHDVETWIMDALDWEQLARGIEAWS